MITADLLSRMGVFVMRNFLDRSTCAALRAVALKNSGEIAKVTSQGEDVYDETTRKTYQIILPKPMEDDLYERIMSLRPNLETHFKVSLEACRPRPILLSYGVGDFFGRHGDTYDNPDFKLPENIKRRKVSVVIMVNDASESEEPDTYWGGALTFYGLMQDPRLKLKGFPLKGEEGLLVAFDSHTIHEVQPVMRGKRYTVVTWFF